jgi:hypothetical protein
MSTTAARHRKRQSHGQPWLIDLFEHVSELSSKVDRESGIIRDVKVLGSVSRNGRTYSDRAKQDACKLLEGITVNFDHKRKPEEMERGFMEGIGSLHGLEVRPDGVYAKELRVKKSHPNAEVLFESAERFPKSFGLSINAAGTTNKAGDIVESIKQARSVDIVGNPATTNGLFESTNHKARRMVKTSIKQIVESMGNKDYSARCSKIMEDGASAAMMGAPVEMDDPGVDENGDATQPDPIEQMKDAFAALIITILENDGMDAAAKKKQIGDMIDTMDELLNGKTAAKPVTEEDTSETEGDDEMTESVKQQLTEILESVKESNTLFKETSTLTKRNAASIRLIEAGVEPLPERIDAVLGAKDESATVALIESLPPKQRSVIQKPRMRPSDEPEAETVMPTDPKAVAKRWKS